MLDVDCCSDVRILILHGMGGVGKTTLAKVIYNELSCSFGQCCAFLDDIRETLEKVSLISLQKKLLTEIVGSRAAKSINDIDHGKMRIQETLGNKKALIVLDDVDNEKQIENLMGQGRLHPGTRIIITTRYASVLEKQRMAHEMKEMNSDHALQILPYEMKEMSSDHAVELFKRHAFLEGSLAKDFDRLSRDIVNTTGGLPLALEVIGALLREKNEVIWKEALDKLKEIPHEDVQKKLMISYEALNNHQREIFLDVACFLINEDMTNAIYMWSDCRFYPNLEIDILISMSLIKIKDDNRFWMHDQLRILGQNIVRQGSSKDLGKRSRLWTSEEDLDFVRTKERKENVEALDLQGISSYIFISNEEIERFESLRFLRLSKGSFLGDFIVSLPKLRWMSWSFPLPDCTATSMHLKNLVVLELFDNHFADDSKVWDIIKMATKLKSLALVRCHHLTRTPDLSKCLALERLTFDQCRRLKEIDNSITKLTCLLDLNITHCELLEQVPEEIRGLVKLERFSLKSCYEVHGLPTSIGDLASLRKLDLSKTGITSLPDSIGKLRCLSDLNLLGSGITQIPGEIEGLVELRHLCLRDTRIKQLPDSIGRLKSLCTLDLSFFLIEVNSNQLELPKTIGMLEKLEELYLANCEHLVGEIPNEIGHLSSLRVLDLCWTKISKVPRTINMLSHLSTLDLTGCDEITELPELPANLVHLRFKSRSLQVVPNLSKLINLVELLLSDGSDYGDSSNLKHKCDLEWIGRLSKLKKLELCLLNIAAPPTELGPLSLLEDLTLHNLDFQALEQLPPLLSLKLVNFSSTGSLLSKLKILSNLTLRFSRSQEIQLNGLLSLQSLCLEKYDLQSLSIPSSLRKLSVYKCPNMVEIQFLGMSASLEELSIVDCRSIGRIVLCGDGGSLSVLDHSKSSSESTYCSPGVLLLPNALKKLKILRLLDCKNVLEIQVIGTLLSLLDISIRCCDAMEKFRGISNMKNLLRLVIYECSNLRVVEGLDELEFMTRLNVNKCHSLEKLLDILNSKIPYNCQILVNHCRKSLDSLSPDYIPFERYRRMARQGVPQLETNKEEAKMEEDAKEPGTKLQPQFHPSTSSRDHQISKEPPIGNVREGTPPGQQNQTMEKDSHRLKKYILNLTTTCFCKS